MCRAWIRRAYPNRVRTSRRIRLGEHHVHELGGGVDSQGCLWSFYKKRKKRREREKERENVNKLPCLSPSLYPILTPCCYSFTSSPLAFCAPLPPSPDACIYTWFLEYCPHGGERRQGEGRWTSSECRTKRGSHVENVLLYPV